MKFRHGWPVQTAFLVFLTSNVRLWFGNSGGIDDEFPFRVCPHARRVVPESGGCDSGGRLAACRNPRRFSFQEVPDKLVKVHTALLARGVDAHEDLGPPGTGNGPVPGGSCGTLRASSAARSLTLL